MCSIIAANNTLQKLNHVVPTQCIHGSLQGFFITYLFFNILFLPFCLRLLVALL